MQWFNRQKNNALTAIRNKGEMTYIAQVMHTANAKPVVQVAEVEISKLQAINEIENITKKFQLDKTPVSYLLEHNDYQRIQIEKPNVPDNELKEAVRWSLKDLVNTPVEDITLDIIDIPKSNDSENNQDYIYVVFAQNEFIANLSNNLINAKMNLKYIEARIMAQRNIANHLATDGEGEAVLTFSANGALLTFTHLGEICNARFIEIDPDRTDGSFEKISLEIQRSLDGFEAKFRNVFIKKILVAPFNLREPFCDHLRESIYTKVETFELIDVFDFAPNVDIGDMSRQSSFLHVLGAALREEAAL